MLRPTILHLVRAIVSTLFCLGLPLLFSGVAHAQVPPNSITCNDGQFPLYCRGQLSLALQWGTGGAGYYIYFAPNATKAGIGGASLAPGTCAWFDRPLTPLESSTPLQGDSYLSTGNISPLFHMVNRCVGDTSCVLELCAGIAFEGSQGLVIDRELGATLLR